MGNEGSGKDEERRTEEERRRIAEDRAESFRTLLDQANEMLSPIMSNERIRTMPYKEVLIELERRRVFLEKNREYAEKKQMEQELLQKRMPSQNQQGNGR